MLTGTATLPSWTSSRAPCGGSAAESRGKSASSVSTLESRMRKSCRQHVFSDSKIGSRDSRQIASGACNCGTPSAPSAFGSACSAVSNWIKAPCSSRKVCITAGGRGSYHTMHAPYIRDLSAAVSTKEVTTGMALTAATSAVTSLTPWGKQNAATSGAKRMPALSLAGSLLSTAGSKYASSSGTEGWLARASTSRSRTPASQ
mmetsp:Transcript_15306/g.42681  ORF Transcript_15306/g.42681 Transcript_15306/m.42681 type:complete len:202 (+) Transcript_15306:320-925(+)|eukprot:scaffold203574_cov32-Tisochrysis_lutea.AAC.1